MTATAAATRQKIQNGNLSTIALILQISAAND